MTDYPHPNVRRLRIFSFDPALAASHDLAGISGMTIEIPWENDLKPGPVGEYIEVIDVDPASGAAYPPVDLNAPALLATDGLAPSESDPRFHQQMVYAVAMKTIEHFERALGRKALWSITPAVIGRQGPSITRTMCLGCASIRTRCASRMPITARRRRRCCSAISRPRRKTARTRRARPCSLVCRTTSSRTRRRMRCSTACTRASTSRSTRTCSPFMRRSPTSSRCSSTSRIRACCATRSRAHAATLRAKACSANSRNSSRWHPDAATLCATILAGRTRRASGSRQGPIRPCWSRRAEPHDRGAILVAAVFGAFTKVYRTRTSDLFRIATEGTGVLREGDIHPGSGQSAGEGSAALCRPRAADVHPRDRLLPAGRDHVRRLSARPRHRRSRHVPCRPGELAARLHRELPRVGNIAARHALHGGGQPALADRGARSSMKRQIATSSKGADKARKASRNLMEQIFSSARPDAKSKDYQQRRSGRRRCRRRVPRATF